MPRSGTKLLRNLINRHPMVRIPEIETEFLPWLSNNLVRFGDLSTQEAFHELYGVVSRFPFFMYLRTAEHCIDEEEWRMACSTYDAKGIFEALLRLVTGATASSGIIWVDKSPSYINDIPLIASLWPDARFIHIVRDVRDYCLSINKAWGKDMLRAAQRWTDGVSTARRDGRALGARYMEVRYEDLLSRTEECMRCICDHLEIEFDPAMLTLDKPSENLGDARGVVGVRKDNKAKYINQMSASLLMRIEAITGPVLREFGYELIHELQPVVRIGFIEMRLRQLKDAVNLVRHESKEGGLLRALFFHSRYFRATRG